MTEGRLLLMACAAWLGVSLALPLWLPVVALAVLIAWLIGRDVLIIVAVFFIATALGARAEAAHVPLPPHELDDVVTLITDPEPGRFGWRGEARLPNGKRVLYHAAGPAGWALAEGRAGEQWHLAGRVGPADQEPWLIARHIVGSASIDGAKLIGPPHWLRTPSEWLRDGVSAGAKRLPRAHQSLYLGLVIGDDRFQEASQRARFRGAGMTHLLAVSGQNVAFALAVARPLLSRLPLGARTVATLWLLAVFAVATRLEPSVVRATVTAAVAVYASHQGVRATGTRPLAVAVTILVLIDPLLSRSIGFQLSVAASLGIILLGPAITARVRGPGPLREAVGVTLAAQIGVSPLLLTTFGPISSVTLPANVAAGWAAGATMTWGLSLGLLAPLLPPTIDRVLQMPAGWLVWWIDGVAIWASRVPAPVLDGRLLLLLFALGLALWWSRSIDHSFAVVGRAVLVLLGALLAIASVAHPPSAVTDLDGGGRWFPSSAGTPSVLVVESDASDRLVDALVTQRITSIDIVVLERGHRPAARLAEQLQSSAVIGVLLAPPQHRVVGARRLLQPVELQLAHDTLRLTPDREVLGISEQNTLRSGR